MRQAWSVIGLVVAGAALAGCTATSVHPDAAPSGQHDGTPDPSPAPSPTVRPTVPAPDDDPTDITAQVPDPAVPPLHAESAEELAARILRAEDITRNAASPANTVAAAAFDAQVLYRQLAATPDWHAEVLDLIGDQYRPAVRAHLTARTQLRAMHTRLSDTLPAWRIVDPAPADELLAHYRKAQDGFGIPWEILAAINLVETAMGRIDGLSVAGAQGPMQFMPGTWAAFGEGDVNDPHDAIMAAARYLAHNGGAEGRIDNALYRYNNSDRYVTGVRALASILQADPAAFLGLYHWQVVYLSEIGDIWLPVGYEQTERIPVTDYVAANPSHHLGTATN